MSYNLFLVLSVLLCLKAWFNSVLEPCLTLALPSISVMTMSNYVVAYSSVSPLGKWRELLTSLRKISARIK